MTIDEYKVLAAQIAKDDPEATEFLVKLNELCSLWDNMWDGDHVIDREHVDEILSFICFEFSRNSFFKKYRDVLEAQIFVSWNAWHAANLWKKDKNAVKRHYAFFIKEYCFEIEHLVAWLIGGKEHAKQMNLIIREAALTQLMHSKPYFFED